VSPKGLKREVDPVTLDDVLANVPQEVRHLERLAELRRVRQCLGFGLLVEFHNCRHHSADRSGRAVHVRFEFLVRLVPVGVDVARHRVDEGVDVFVGDIVFAANRSKRVQHGAFGRIIDRRSPERSVAKPVQLCALLVRRRGLFSVDDLVSDSKESVQHVRRVTDSFRKQPRGNVERLPGTALDLLAPGNLCLLYHADLWRPAGRVASGSPIMPKNSDSNNITVRTSYVGSTLSTVECDESWGK